MLKARDVSARLLTLSTAPHESRRVRELAREAHDVIESLLAEAGPVSASTAGLSKRKPEATTKPASRGQGDAPA